MLPLAPIHAQAYEQLWGILSNGTACILHKNVNKPRKCYVPHYFQHQRFTSRPQRYLHSKYIYYFHSKFTYYNLLSYQWQFVGIVLQEHCILFQCFLPYWFTEFSPLLRWGRNYSCPFQARAFNKNSITGFMTGTQQTWKHGALITIVGWCPSRVRFTDGLNTLVFTLTAIDL